jgi:2-phosphoglycerate kinase
VVEGVHVVPGSLSPELRASCVLVEALLVVGDEALHRGHFSHRPGTRPAERYLAAFDEIRALQAHLAAGADAAGVAVIDNANVDEALARLMELVLDAVERAT